MKTKILSLALLMCALSFAGCNDKPDIQTAYDFSLSSWYLQKSAKYDEEVEIRFYLDREGDWKDAKYDFCYIQLDGEGRVYNTDRRILTSREYYPLRSLPGLDETDTLHQVFTLWYRAGSDRKSELKFILRDNFGQEREYLVSFNPDTTEEEE